MKKSRIPGTSALNKATTLIRPRGKRWKDDFAQGGDLGAERQNASQTASNSFPVYGQLVGATMAISDGIRGDNSDATANAIANVISPTSGIRNAYDTGHSEDILVSAFNPIGGGILAAQRSEEDLAKQQAKYDAVVTRRLIDNSGAAFAKGGKISTYPKVKNGGSLSPISPDAVEVVGNNPNAVDGVELDNAFVDHKEIIDRENRVFSDEIAGPNGKSIASNAKRLEKMKNNNPRFSGANAHVDTKIDDLFNFQEQVKKLTPQPPTPAPAPKREYDATIKAQEKNFFGRDFNKDPFSLQEWRYRRDDRDYKRYPMTGADYKEMTIDKAKQDGDYKYVYEQQMKAKSGLKKGGKLPKKAFGGSLPFKYNATEFSDQEGQMDLNPNGMFDQSGEFAVAGGSEPRTGGNSGNWQSVAGQAASFAPNIASALGRKNLKGPATPTLESPNYLSRVSAEPQLADATRQFRLAQQVVNRNTAQGSNLVSATGSLLAKRLANQNQIYGDVNRQNASIQAQETGMNAMTRARNVERVNNYNQSQNDFKNKKISLSTENIANASTKFQQMTRERNQMDRDAQQFQLIQSAYGDSGVLARLWRDNPELASSIERSMGVKSGTAAQKAGKRMGGRLAKLNSSYC